MADSLSAPDKRPPSSIASSSRPQVSAGLTTFPNPFADEPEQGILPALFSKVKSTFSAATNTPIIYGARPAEQGKAVPSEIEPGQTPTEAQLIAAAAKERAALSGRSSAVGTGSGPPSGGTSLHRGRSPANLHGSTPPRQDASSRSLRPPSPHGSGSRASSRQGSSTASVDRNVAPTRRLVPPGERRWTPSGAAPAKVSISPVTSMNNIVQAHGSSADSPELGYSVPPRTHFHLQNATASSSSRPPHAHHVHRDSLSSLRPRRPSFATTIPDSPSSVSLSAMLTANAELSQHMSYVPGFPLGQDDTRSVRSMAMGKQQSRAAEMLVKRLRGEGLSKVYWMPDEHCKACYDCKSTFSAWRRKHHCRLCGQIYCGRCASNIIGARRFGAEGAVRVCNLCLKLMDEYREEDDDDRRSVLSLSTSGRRLSLSDRALHHDGNPMSPELPYARSPFAASQLFTTHEDGLQAIEEGSVPHRWESTTAEEMERSFTPNGLGSDGDDSGDDDDDPIWAMRPQTAAPFRRPIDASEEGDQDGSRPPSPSETAGSGLNGSGSRSHPRRFGLPRVDTTTSTEYDGEYRPPLERYDSNLPLRMRLSSRTSQGGLTALIDAERKEGLWRQRSHSFIHHRPRALPEASLKHFELMLKQAIERAGLSSPDEWHRTLSRILLKVGTNLSPNVRAGDSIDVRAYVKIKKVPGGKISDSEYVDGIVISKNVAHKAMARRLVNPRIMPLTFPLDYQRVENQLMSLEPIMAQERDYLRLLTRRIIDVRPHIVLVERSVSRIALNYLLDAGIAVARSVKRSAINQVARCTQADIVASMDRLAVDPRLGRCAEFQIQSFEHELIPGRRKTLMRFEGCSNPHGCTIILRGGDLAVLRKVKVVTEFMALVAYQLKNEVILYNDEHNVIPPEPLLPPEYKELLDQLVPQSEEQDQTVDASSQMTPSTAAMDDEKKQEQMDDLRLTRQIAETLRPYLETALSASAAIRFPPPAPLARMAELDRLLNHLKRSRDEEEMAKILQEETKDSVKNVPSDVETAGVAPASEKTETILPVELPAATAMGSLPASTANKVKDPYRVLRQPEEISKESAIARVKHEHQEQVKLWQWYTRKHTATLRPEDFQGIVYVESLGCEGGDKPCVEPRIQHIDFYQSDDLTLGQFLEHVTADEMKACPSKSCERPLLHHFRLMVHGERRLQIAMDRFDCPSPGHEDQIITWSYCRVCKRASPTGIISEETWKMSWGAYLEHCFYPPKTTAGFTCPHDAYRDQIRYFAHQNLAVRIHNEHIDLYEPLRPSIVLQSRAETKVVLKNKEYESALSKNAAFFDSVLFRLRSFDYDIIQPEKRTTLKTALEALLARAVADREEMVNLLNRTYKLSPMTDVLALNTALRALQDKVVQWDTDFADVEKTFLPSEKDLRRMTATHLRRLFANQDAFNTLDRNDVAGLSVSEADEKEGKEDETPVESGSVTPADTVASASSDLPAEHDAGPNEGSGDEPTPLPRLDGHERNPISVAASEADDDSDSTIGATPGTSAKPSPGLGLGGLSSEFDSDAAHVFRSRLPRRSKPAPSIADLVKRFQESTQSHVFEPLEDVLERPRSTGSMRRSQRQNQQDISDSDQAMRARPRLRRGRTEQPPSAKQREGLGRAGLVSDSERSYATNASRIPSSQVRRPGLEGGMQRSSTLRPRDYGELNTSPERGNSLLRPPLMSRGSSSSIEKPRLGGKGKTPQPGLDAPFIARTSSSSKRGRDTPGSRVTSIARHFDRLSREAERERQKRISMVRGKRARPVAVTKAKVEVFDNLRDAFKDEFDTDSSEADNEEDDGGSDDSADSAGKPKSRRSSSSRKSPKAPAKMAELEPLTTTTTTATATTTPPQAVPTSQAVQASPAEAGDIPASVSNESTASDVKSEMSFTDRLQIELPSFETSAPLPSVPATPQLSLDTADDSKGEASGVSRLSDSELSSGGGERSSILKTLTGLWAFRAGDYTPLEYPLSASEHIFADSKVIIRENEPTSIIAFTLSSKNYRDTMRSSASAQQKKAEAFMPDDPAGPSDRSTNWDLVSLDEAVETDDPSRRDGGVHLKYDFESGSSTIFCRIFFAEQFAALRSACQCEDSFVESLARCVQFDASGGKSGSAFLKTKDDRFIAKEISRLEMDALTKFAPAYFDYTRKAYQGQRPTVLAKIYGFFKIGYRNAITGRSLRMNVLIMENLFYERRFSKIYDLKGSTRNRLIQPTGRVNEVLLDENLMEIVYKQPLYLREHAKRVLRTALFNDTLFLSNLNVMDYSLVVGVDSEKHELVVGIVDYIRTFTWDKKLESWVKDSGFLGGAGKGEPTIVTPKQYKARFRAAMERYYFPSVPDRWTKIGAEDPPPDEDAIVPIM